MLRDFVYSPTVAHLASVLAEFGFHYSNDNSTIAVLRFEVITPDSFMWRLLIHDNIYYLYAEDHIPHREYVEKLFKDYLNTDAWEFIVSSADSSGEATYGITSGYDTVFLVKSAEDATDALFSEHAPRGFI